MKKVKKKYAVIYTDGGWRDKPGIGGGHGIHGYAFDELQSVRFAKAPALITPIGYQPKPTGAQLKDDKYNPSWEQWGYSKDLKSDKVEKVAEGIVIIDAIIPNGNTTAQVNELKAFIEIITNETVDVEYYTIHSDSQYLVDGWNKDMANWKARNWKLSTGLPVKNLELWKQIDEIKESMGDRICLLKIKAHDGHEGNELADERATAAVAATMNGRTEPFWLFHDAADIDYWDIERPIPPIMRTKWIYALSDTEVRASEVDGITYHHYFTGEHNKSADDVELLGKQLPDASFGLILHDSRVEVVDNVRRFHEEHMWTHDCDSYKSQLMMMIAPSTINTEKLAHRLKYFPTECHFLQNERNDFMDSKKNLLSKVIRPPKLSFRALDIEKNMFEIMVTALRELGHEVKLDEEITPYPGLVVDDVTDLFYVTPEGKGGKPGATKLTDLYDMVAKTVELQIKNPVAEPTKVIMRRGIDLPQRNMMSALSGENPKVYTLAWEFDRNAFSYAFMIKTDHSIGIWMNPYSCTRFLKG